MDASFLFKRGKQIVTGGKVGEGLGGGGEGIGRENGDRTRGERRRERNTEGQ